MACQQVELHGWTALQLADQAALSWLYRLSHYWDEYDDRQQREEPLQRFHDYAYQWY